MPIQRPITVTTIGDYRDGRYSVSVSCRACGHMAKLDLDALADRLGADRPLADVRLRCSACVSRDIGWTIGGPGYL